MNTNCDPSPLEEWRKRLGGRRRHGCPSRPLAALGYLTRGPMIDGLIEIDRLMLVLLHDEPDERQRQALWLKGFSGARVPWGVEWGGPRQSKFFKNLLLQPMPHARGLRLDAAGKDLLRLGLQLDRDLQRHAHDGRRCRHSTLTLPPLWAGFSPGDTTEIRGGGPELAAYCRRTGQSPAVALHRLRRPYCGSLILPLPWVSHHWRQFTVVLADLSRFARRQVFPLTAPAVALVGYQGAAQYDFLRTRFRPPRVDTPLSPAFPVTVAG